MARGDSMSRQHKRATVDGPRRPARWSIVIPYYNEWNYLPSTLASLLDQDYRGFRLILVDNGSTDGSETVCRDMLRVHPDIEAIFLREPRAGKIHALECGLAFVDTEYVAFCDADTYYPPHYLSLCTHLLDHSSPHVVGAMAIDIYDASDAVWTRVRRHYHAILSRILARQAHTGGFGQTFRTSALRTAGGYSARYWTHVLEDHEVMHRIFKIGTAPHHPDLWCRPSTRRAGRAAVRWTLIERLLYHFVPFDLKDWFFYDFLDRRFTRRGLHNVNLREKSWETSHRSPDSTQGAVP